MDIYERLKDDHDKQRGLLGGLEDTSGDSNERKRLFGILKRELEAHANAEEQTFYAALIAEPHGQQKARHSIVEHCDMNELIAELEDIDMAQGAWLKKFKDLRHKVEHHVDEEEAEVFVQARKVLANAEAEELVDKFNTRKALEEARLP